MRAFRKKSPPTKPEIAAPLPPKHTLYDKPTHLLDADPWDARLYTHFQEQTKESFKLYDSTCPTTHAFPSHTRSSVESVVRSLRTDDYTSWTSMMRQRVKKAIKTVSPE